MAWVSTAYLPAMAAVIPVAGRAVERFRRPDGLAGPLAVFTVGSLVCGVTWSAGSLVGASAAA